MNWLTSRYVPVVAFVALALSGCDTGTALNVDLPDTTAVNTQYQDLPLSVATVRLAPVQTLKTDHFLVGRLNDNIAGETVANAYLNVLDAKAVVNIGASVTDTLPSTISTTASPAILDSAVMVMGFDQVYGSATTPARFDVFPLATPLDDRQVYNSGMSQPVAATPLGLNLTSRLDRTQRVVVTAAVPAVTNAAGAVTTAAIPAVMGTAADPTVRLVLQRRAVPANGSQPAIPEVNPSLFGSLFTKLSQPGFTQATLNGELTGLAIKPSAGYTGGIVAFSRGYRQRIIFYYHTDAATRRTYSVYFGPVYSSLNLSSSRDPRYYTEITNNALPANLAALSSRAGTVDPVVLNGSSFVQEGTGLGTRVSFTGLSDLIAAATAGGLTINRAELRVPIKPYSNALFNSPSLLYAVEVDGRNNVLQRIVNYIPTDRVVQADGSNPTGTNSYAVGGLVDATTTQAYYTLPITSYLQAYLYDTLGGNPAALVLVPNVQNSSTLALNRAVLDAANIKLRIYYSKR